MKVILNFCWMILAAGVGLGLGFALRSKPAVWRPETAALALSTTNQHAKQKLRAKEPIAMTYHDDSPLAAQLERDLSMSAGVTRWLYWLEAMEKAAPADFPRLLQLTKRNSVAMRLVAARWAEVAPRHMVETLTEATDLPGLPVNELASILFEEWPRRDPQAAIAAVSGTNRAALNSNWRSRVASRICEDDPELGLRLMSDWHINHFSPTMTAVEKWAADDPRRAAEFTIEHPAGAVSRDAIETIGKEWAKSDPAGALKFAMSRSGELSSALARTTLKEWAEKNLTEAADWLAQTDGATRNRFSPSLVEAWAKEDAGTALAWCQENLTGRGLIHAIAGVVKGAAAKDVAAAAGLVASMSPSPARTEAAKVVAERWFPESHNEPEPVSAPALAWLRNLDGESTKRVLEEFQWRWSRSDPKGMAAFLAAANPEHVHTYAYKVAAWELTRHNPEDALEWATHLPGDHALVAGSEAFAQWRASQPDAAAKWLNDLPQGDARRERYIERALQTIAFHPQAAEQIAAMSGTERAIAQRAVQTMDIPEDRRARLLNMFKAP